MFCLVVDDFRVRYKTQADADYLINTLEKYDYKLKDRPNKTVSISMPGYVKKMLQKFRPQFLLPGHRPPRTPGVNIAPSFSKKPQTVFIDRSEKLSPSLITELQAIIGTLLYYARAIDPALLPIANELASQHANATRRILNAANRALSYCAAYNNNQIVHHACDMALHVFADASYLCRSHSRSVAGAIFFLGNHNDPTRINGSIHVFSSIIPCNPIRRRTTQSSWATLNTRRVVRRRIGLHNRRRIGLHTWAMTLKTPQSSCATIPRHRNG